MATWMRGLTGLTVPLLIIGCGGKAEPPPVVIGHMAPLSGSAKAVGESARRGILLAVEEANQDPEGKGPGRRVEVLHTDTHGDPSAFGAEATRLVKINKVAALLGGTTADDIKEFKRLGQAGVLLISPCGMPGQEAISKSVFFTGLSPGDRGKALARFAASKRFRNVAILYRANDQDRALAEAFREQYLEATARRSPRDKGRVQGPWRFDKETPIQKRAQRIAGTRGGNRAESLLPVDAILLAGRAADVKELREELGSGRPAIPVLLGGSEESLGELLEESETGNDVYLAAAFTPDADFDQVKEFVKRFRKRFGEEPDAHAALAYDDARLLFAAMRQDRDKEGDTLPKVLAEMKDFPGLTGPVSFDGDYQVRRVAFVVRIEGGKASPAARYGVDK